MSRSLLPTPGDVVSVLMKIDESLHEPELRTFPGAKQACRMIRSVVRQLESLDFGRRTPVEGVCIELAAIDRQLFASMEQAERTAGVAGVEDLHDLRKKLNRLCYQLEHHRDSDKMTAIRVINRIYRQRQARSQEIEAQRNAHGLLTLDLDLERLDLAESLRALRRVRVNLMGIEPSTV